MFHSYPPKLSGERKSGFNSLLLPSKVGSVSRENVHMEELQLLTVDVLEVYNTGEVSDDMARLSYVCCIFFCMIHYNITHTCALICTETKTILCFLAWKRKNTKVYFVTDNHVLFE